MPTSVRVPGSIDDLLAVPGTNRQQLVRSGSTWSAKTPSFISLRDSGIIDGANLANGSTDFGTDQTAALQAILDLATGGPLGVLWDVRCSHTGLNVRSDTELVHPPGCGWILRTNSDRPALRNQNWTSTGFGTPDRRITIRGGIFNGNGGTLAAHNQAHHNVTYGWMTCLSLMGIEDVLIEGVKVINSRTYGMHIAGFKRLRIVGCDVDDGLVPGQVEANHDGFHFNGPWQDGALLNCSGSCRDDHFSLCANDGTEVFSVPYPNVGGPGTDFVVSDFRIRNAGAGGRALSRGDPITGLTIRGIRGDCTSYALLLDNFDDEGGTYGPGAFRSTLIDDVDVVITGGPPLALIRLGGLHDQVIFRNIRKNRHPYDQPMLLLDNSLGADYVAFDFSAVDQGAGAPLASPIIQGAAGRIGHLDVTGQVARNGALSSAAAPVLRVAGAAIDQARIRGQFYGIKNVVKWESAALGHVDLDAIHSGAGMGSDRGAVDIATGLVLANYRRSGGFVLDKSGAGTVTNPSGSWVTGQFADLPTTVGLQNQSEFDAAGTPAITAYTPDVGAVWLAPFLAAGQTADVVTGGKAVHTPVGADGRSDHVCEAFVADGTIVCRFKNTAGSAGNGFGILFGYTNSTNFNVLNMDTGGFAMYSIVGGTGTARGSNGTPVTNNVDHEIVLRRVGSTVTVTLDGTTLTGFTAVPANLATTKHGFYHFGNCAGGVLFYRFYR